MQISIILATYNWPKALELILANLLPQFEPYPQVELIVADDGSTVETKMVINHYMEKFPNRIKHVWQEDEGFRKTIVLNKAVAISKGEYLLFLDGDCIPFKDYLSMHLKLMEPGFFVAGNRVLFNKNFSQAILSKEVNITSILNWQVFDWFKARILGKVDKTLPWLRLNTKSKWRYSRSNNWRFPKGCNLGVWRKDFIQVNGFDEIFNGWGHEDADLFVRLLHAKVKIKDGRFAIPVIHLWHEKFSRDNEEINWSKLMTRIADINLIKAEIGLDRHNFC